MIFSKKTPPKQNTRKSATPYRNMSQSGNNRSKSARPVNIRSSAAVPMENSTARVSELPRSQRPSRNMKQEFRKKKTSRKLNVKKWLLMLLLLVIIGAGAYLGWNVLQSGYFGKQVSAFSTAEIVPDILASKENLRAQSFAQKLCVSSKGDVDRVNNVSLEDGEEGLLFNLSNHKILYAKGIYDRVYPASITKIMTAMLALKNGNLDDVVTITQENVNLEEGSQVCGFVPGDQVTLDQLLHCLLVYSGNDAASAIAQHVGGTTEQFVEMMNAYAAQLGCTGTHFTNPHGLQDENHYTTPYDIYLMLNEAWTYPEFTEITQLSSYTVDYTNADGTAMSTTLTATDHYLTGEATAPKDVTILGGKTGTTDSAGNCLAILTQNAYGKPFVSIVMGASTKELLYQQMNSLLQNIN